MGKIRKIRLILGLKGILSIACLTTIALALVVYTASVTMTPKFQFYIGATTDSWDMYINEVNQIRYLPGNIVAPTLNDADTTTYAFKVVTDANRVCAVEINQTSPEVNATTFDLFDIRVRFWTGSGWALATLYTSETGTTTMTEINALTGQVGYIHQEASVTRYYLIEVTYTYDIDSELEANTVNAEFSYTPLARASF